MAAPAKKPGLLIALGGAPKGGAAEPDGDEGMGDGMSSDEPDGMAVKDMAANDAFDAMKSGDRALFADALDRYVKACMGEM